LSVFIKISKSFHTFDEGEKVSVGVQEAIAK